MLTVEQIEKKFGSHVVLDGVSFDVDKGEIFGLIGKNGAGKTTLMNIMAGVSSADKGTCSVDGAIITPGGKQVKAGYLPDLPAFYEYLTAGEYLGFLLKGKNSQKKMDLLDLVELDENIKISAMSRGMRQRLGIAAAIVNDPDVLLLDEPTSALDPGGRAEVMRILNDLKRKGKSIVLSTHILADMERVCDKVGFLHEGVLKRIMPISDLDKSCSFLRVVFENKELSEGIFGVSGVKYSILEDQTYRFEIDETDPVGSQKAVFRQLSLLDTQVISIHNESNNLDNVFQEVCG